GPLRDLLHDTLLASGAASGDWLEPRAVERLVRQHVTGRGNHGRALWSLLVLEQWARAYLGHRGAVDEVQTDLVQYKTPNAVQPAEVMAADVGHVICGS
ncbi:MAG: hypothetical protein HY718_13155, partial [Planctomycetes bacterium]|nr:hypothetical protein [Planctomycetota bacterium]